MNSNQPMQTPDCQQWAPLLPLLDDPTTDSIDILAAREHVKECRYCRAECERYAMIDSTLRRYYGLSSVLPHRTEDLLQYITEQGQVAPEPEQPIATEKKRGIFASSRRGVFTSFTAVVGTLLIITFAVVLFSNRMSGREGLGAVTGSPQISFPGTQGYLSGISMVTSNEGWALGQVTKVDDTDHALDEVAFYHYLNNTWKPVYVKTNHTFEKGGFNGNISMVSPSEGWAAVNNFNTYSTLFHYVNGTWMQVADAPETSKVKAISSTSVWALTSGVNSDQSAIVHFNGTSWQKQDLGADRIIDFTMLSDTQGWALVETAGQFKVLQYASGSWTQHSSLTGEDVQGFVMLSSSEGWAVGEKLTKNFWGDTTHVPQQQVIYHYTNGKWNEAQVLGSSNIHMLLSQIVMLSANDGWIVGQKQNAYFGATTKDFRRDIILLHYDGTSWKDVAVPQLGVPADGIIDLTFTPDGIGWACGYVSTYSSNDVLQDTDVLTKASPLLLNYTNGVWQFVRS
jgi:hypothetical protein